MKIISLTSSQLLVTLCTIQWKWRLQKYENVTKLLCILRVNRLTKTGIYHIIVYSWHYVTHMWLVMGVFSDLSCRVTHMWQRKWEILFSLDWLVQLMYVRFSKNNLAFCSWSSITHCRKCSPLKVQINCNLVQVMFVRSSYNLDQINNMDTIGNTCFSLAAI
jgi:hypothetical protein